MFFGTVWSFLNIATFVDDVISLTSSTCASSSAALGLSAWLREERESALQIMGQNEFQIQEDVSVAVWSAFEASAIRPD
jgi:hypothetical protein